MEPIRTARADRLADDLHALGWAIEFHAGQAIIHLELKTSIEIKPDLSLELPSNP